MTSSVDKSLTIKARGDSEIRLGYFCDGYVEGRATVSVGGRTIAGEHGTLIRMQETAELDETTLLYLQVAINEIVEAMRSARTKRA